MGVFDDVLRAVADELNVCCDALLEAGWPPSRMLQIRESTPRGHKTTIALTKGPEFNEQHVFVAAWEMDGLEIKIRAGWLLPRHLIPPPDPDTALKQTVELAALASE